MLTVITVKKAEATAMDSVRGHHGTNFRECSVRSEALRADLVQRNRQVAPASLASESARQETLAFCNSTLRDLDSLRELRYSPDLSILFPRTPEEQELYRALLVRSRDNDTAREVKNEYRALLNDIKKDAALARKLVAKLGPGTHTLSNGDVVVISRDRSGNVRVRTTRSDGSSQDVAYNEDSPQDVRIRERSVDGQTTVTERHGQSVSRTEGRVETSYSLDDQGCPVRERRGPGHDDFVKTTVNEDGSTDTRELLYYQDEVEEGEDAGVYEDTHEPARRPHRYRDAGAGKAIEELRRRNPEEITPEMLIRLIQDATQDFDGQAAGREYQDLKDFMAEVSDRLTPEARQVWEIYEKYVHAAQAKGQTGIEDSEHQKMLREMGEVSESEYQDEGAAQAIEDLEARNPSRIDGRLLVDLILRATVDADNQSAGAEYDDLKAKLTPEAKDKWQVYERFVYDARAKGETGLTGPEYLRMMGELFG
jgi:hypothetical protein